LNSSQLNSRLMKCPDNTISGVVAGVFKLGREYNQPGAR
jgi:hypothetical protein